MKTAREFLKEYNEKEGWGTDDGELIETLIDAGKIVHREGRDEHRWYICETVVTDIDGTFIQFYTITGDNSMRDMDLEYDLDAARIVDRKERQVTEVYYI